MSNVKIDINNIDNSVYQTLNDWAKLCAQSKQDFPDSNHIVMRLPKDRSPNPISVTFSFDWKMSNNMLRRKKIEKIFNI